MYRYIALLVLGAVVASVHAQSRPAQSRPAQSRPARSRQAQSCRTRGCPPGYVYNPFSCTCFRLITNKLSWANAQSDCRERGDELAVLTSVESINWFKNLRQTNNAWKSGWVWIGGKRSGGKWRWDGRVSTEIILGDWEQVQPDGGDNYCIQVFDNTRATNSIWENYKWDDYRCTRSNYYVCEK